MASLDSLMRRTRIELADVKEPFYERFSTSAEGVRYDLSIENVETFFLYPEGNPAGLLTEGVDYTLDKRRGVVTFHQPQDVGARFVAEGESARYFSDEEIRLFTETAFDMHTRGRGINYSSLPSVEVLLVAILAQIEALWVLKTSAAYDVNIHAPEGMFIPRGQRFQQLNVLIQEMEARYKELSNALGVGLYAVEMFTLRRVSRLTGRYVPVYLDREVEDTRPPQRVFPGVDSQFAELGDATIDKHDLQVMQGRRFEERFAIEEDVDLATSSFEASLYRTPYQTSHFRDVLPDFTVTVDANTREVVLTLTPEETKRLETSGAYVWVLRWNESAEEGVLPLLQGRVFVESGFPLKNMNVTVG